MRFRFASDRGHADHGWLDTYHTFSFAGHYDPNWMGHRNLRVLNQDRIQPGTGFGAHQHQDMEIVSFVLEGALGHEDSMGNKGVIRPGEVQRMTAGTGVTHAEMNAHDGVTEFLQMWIVPDEKGLEPGYDQRAINLDANEGLVAVAGPPGAEAPISLNADARLYAAKAEAGSTLHHDLERHGWLHVARGNLRILDQEFGPGDGAGLEPGPIEITTTTDTILILWDLP